MGRRAAPWRLVDPVCSTVLHAAFAFLATALVTVFGALPANALTSGHASADATGAGTPAVVATVLTGGAGSLDVPGGSSRGSVPGGSVLTAASGADDGDDRGVTPPGADVSHRARPAGPDVAGPALVARAPRPSSGVTSTVRGRAPPA